MLTCSSCGHENPDGAKFCMECATTLSASASPGGARKIISALFCDLVGSTALAEHHDPEVLRPILDGYFTEMRSDASVVNPYAREQRLTSEAQLRKGSTYVWVAEFMGRRSETNAELTEFEPNRKWAYKSTSSSTASSGSYSLEPGRGRHQADHER